MNIVKYYRRNRAGGIEIAMVKVHQGVRTKPVHRFYPNLQKSRRPSVAHADRSMLKAGYTRKKLWLTIPIPTPAAKEG